MFARPRKGRISSLLTFHRNFSGHVPCLLLWWWGRGRKSGLWVMLHGSFLEVPKTVFATPFQMMVRAQDIYRHMSCHFSFFLLLRFSHEVMFVTCTKSREFVWGGAAAVNIHSERLSHKNIAPFLF